MCNKNVKFLGMDVSSKKGERACANICTPNGKVVYSFEKKYFKPGMFVRSDKGDYGVVISSNYKLDTATVCTRIGQYGGTVFTTYDNASIILTDSDKANIGIVGLNPDSLTDGECVRTVIYIGGCDHFCPECHNKNYWSDYGTYFNIDKFYDDYIMGNKHVTISGGDGLTMQYDQTLLLLKLLKFKGHDVWLYTGYTFEQLMHSHKKECLNYIDVLVDGRYEKDKRDITLKFKGSSNQRIIDVKKSLEKDEVVLYELEEL